MQISVQYQDELVAKYLGWNPSRFEWDNPVHSANLGCAYLADLVRRFGTWGAVACYNAGEGRYRQLWKGRQLPAETIEYLKGVLNE
jgi:soluble lytic murein transglycosylase-like protein